MDDEFPYIVVAKVSEVPHKTSSWVFPKIGVPPNHPF